MELPRVDKMGEELGLTHKINEDVLSSFKNAEKKVRYAWIYNLRDDVVYHWNKFLNKLKIEVK
jgi:hypothetical protein